MKPLKIFMVALVVLVWGCASKPSGREIISSGRLNITCRLAEVDADGYSVFLVSINGQTFEHRSSNGGVEFSVNRKKDTVRVQVFNGKGTFVGNALDHYYFVDPRGKVTYLGNLKSSWYENETYIEHEPPGFTVIGHSR